MHFTIVSYTFPPSKEIGGRRWAKFSQQLAKKGHEVTVICASDQENKEWYEKEFPGINVKVLPKCYPDWLSGYTKSLMDKLKYVFYTRVLSAFTKQNLFDRAYAWKKPMLSALENIHHKKPIDVLVVTGAPFSLLYYGSLFKKRNKEIKYVGDLRDPWTWGSYYGIPILASAKKNFQELSEKVMMEACDMVCFPTEHMGNFLRKKYPAFSFKLYLLAHAYDPDKFPKSTTEEKRQGFIYGGSLYPGIEGYLKKLAEVVKTNPDSGFKWDIYTGSTYPLLDSHFANGSVQKHTFVPEEELFSRIKKSAAYLAFFPPSDKDLISTKFFEIIYTHTPILYIGEEGDVGRFVRENRVGVHILPENMERDLPQYLNGNVPFERDYFDVKQYTFSSVTDNFLNALKNFKN
ncbi:glycosyltransferase [Aurantibacillus circumpalustris]|uniref:glycosyltransferase n=1 Tax=Aurantibacillus circumpalustris TaxID=3036359 RepID=UPI00295B2BF2|nr:glycosyltransferase [Aurantibacillus circumpalustris]